jgi:Fe-S-cluster containining protein
MAWQEILAELAAGRRRLDEQTGAFSAEAARHHSRLYCEKGCYNCCTLTVNCSFAEAWAISRTLTATQRQILAEKQPKLQALSRQAKHLKEFLGLFREQLGGCAFLNHADGCCSIYQLRPFSCRALLSTRNSSWCAVDFGGLHPLEKEAFLSSLDPQLVAFPTHYLAASRELGLELETKALAAMQHHFGVAMSGNLLYQVWLEQEHGLSEVIAQGVAATRALLAARNLNLPYLLHLQEN